MNARDIGLYPKFNVSRTDGRDAPGEKHHGAEYFVLDLNDDPHAIPALAAYAESCKTDYPALATDLRAKISAATTGANEFITVPEVKLPNGIVVPSFQAGKYLSARGVADLVRINADDQPWVNVTYHKAREAAAASGYQIETELQALAIAWDISQQDINWTGGKVGEGQVFMGLHKGTVSSGQPGIFESPNAEERRWHQLSNGERIWDAAGNLYRWIFDDLQGDENGVVTEAFSKTSPSITTAPYPSMEHGMGYIPDAGDDWSGNALIRGGCWSSGSNAGVFRLVDVRPVGDWGNIGFRCTKPIGL